MASTSKEIILKKIRQALLNQAPLPFPGSEGNGSVFKNPVEELDVMFAEEFTKLLGKFVYCIDEKELKDQLQLLISSKKWSKIFIKEEALSKVAEVSGYEGELKDCDASITSCEYLIARTGSIVLSSALESGRSVSVYAPIHICIAYTDQLVYDVNDGLLLLKEKYKEKMPSLITFATGPSRTADIEKTLVVGVHGPKEVYLFLVESSK